MNTTTRTVCLLAGALSGLTLFACDPPPAAGADQDRSVAQNRTPSESQSALRRSTANDGAGAGAAAGASGAMPAFDCGKLEAATCDACCKIAFPDIDVAVKQSLGGCFCADPGECAAPCGDNFCSGKPPTDACSSCMAGSRVCATAMETVCKAGAACAAYVSCLDSCH